MQQEHWQGFSIYFNLTGKISVSTTHGLHGFMIVPLIAIVAVWLIQTIVDLITFLINALLGLTILMWFLVNFIWQIIYNCWWHIASSANDLVAFVWSHVKLPFEVVIHILKSFSLLSLSVTHLVLRILYYIFLLWVFVYLLMLLYRFITQRNWAIQLSYLWGLPLITTIFVVVMGVL